MIPPTHVQCSTRNPNQNHSLFPQDQIYDSMIYHTHKALGKLYPKETDTLYLSFIYPLISLATRLIKQSHHVEV